MINAVSALASDKHNYSHCCQSPLTRLTNCQDPFNIIKLQRHDTWITLSLNDGEINQFLSLLVLPIQWSGGGMSVTELLTTNASKPDINKPGARHTTHVIINAFCAKMQLTSGQFSADVSQVVSAQRDSGY